MKQNGIGRDLVLSDLESRNRMIVRFRSRTRALASRLMRAGRLINIKALLKDHMYENAKIGSTTKFTTSVAKLISIFWQIPIENFALKTDSLFHGRIHDFLRVKRNISPFLVFDHVLGKPS